MLVGYSKELTTNIWGSKMEGRTSGQRRTKAEMIEKRTVRKGTDADRTAQKGIELSTWWAVG